MTALSIALIDKEYDGWPTSACCLVKHDSVFMLLEVGVLSPKITIWRVAAELQKGVRTHIRWRHHERLWKSCQKSETLGQHEVLTVTSAVSVAAAPAAEVSEGEGEDEEGEDEEYYRAGIGGRREQRRNEREARRLVELFVQPPLRLFEFPRGWQGWRGLLGGKVGKESGNEREARRLVDSLVVFASFVFLFLLEQSRDGGQEGVEEKRERDTAAGIFPFDLFPTPIISFGFSGRQSADVAFWRLTIVILDGRKG
jgi:hypothetical protein